MLELEGLKRPSSSLTSLQHRLLELHGKSIEIFVGPQTSAEGKEHNKFASPKLPGFVEWSNSYLLHCNIQM